MTKKKCKRGETKSGRCKRKPGPKKERIISKKAIRDFFGV